MDLTFLKTSLEILLPMLAALAAGALVGVERGLRSEPAGFRTHALVCGASAFLIVGATQAGLHLNDVSASSRIAQGIVTGIGFLGAGVIVREGLSVHGLTTAASVWAVAALGIVFGYGLYAEGLAGTVLLLVVLLGLRGIDKRLPRHGRADLSVRYDAKGALSEAQLREILTEMGLHAGPMTHGLADGVVTHTVQVRAHRKVPTEALTVKLAGLKPVVGFNLAPLDV
jgi:putative Mg2+ transporter-C (MgtC) family protein